MLALPARRAAAGAGPGRELDRRGRAGPWPASPAPGQGGARDGAGGTRSTAARSSARASRTATTTRPASCGWRAPASSASRRCERPRGSSWRTSLLFWGLGAEHAGWLVRCLQEFAQREINLTKIESRPLRERLGNYVFFADLAARSSEPRVRRGARRACGEICEEVRVLGSYPPPRSAREPRGSAGAGRRTPR